jgi:hypothetical protein
MEAIYPERKIMSTTKEMLPEKKKIVNRVIRLPLPSEKYESMIADVEEFRQYIDVLIKECPELFPKEIADGYRMKEIKHSKKLDIPIRRIKIGKISYTVHPSFVMPYLSGTVDKVESALFLRKFNVPFWALVHVFGKDAMYWYRLEQGLGRMSIVGTTIRYSNDLPEHLIADEKHTKLDGDKVYVATTVGGDCILGVPIAENAGSDALTKAYQTFKSEACDLKPGYCPKTVNTDGWENTKTAWTRLFSATCLILCFLHVFIKIRNCSKKKFKEIYTETADKLWNCYKASSKRYFSQRIVALAKWANKMKLPETILAPIQKLRNNLTSYSVSYDHPKAHRTSNMLDRLMQRMDRHLFSMQYFHGSIESAERSIRAWALIYNFAPVNPWTVKQQNGIYCPAQKLNKFAYHPDWLQNLLTSASLAGFRNVPLKAL